MSDKTYLAVNGTLMRGLELNPNMLAAGGVFVREDLTDAHYRLWSIGDRHPGMIRVATGGTAVALEIWELPLVSFATLLLSEPAGLAIGKVTLHGGCPGRTLACREPEGNHAARKLARLYRSFAFGLTPQAP
jgi:hypothetical protein